MGCMLLTSYVMTQDSRGEVQRLIDTFKIAAEEATRLYGALMILEVPHKVQARVVLRDMQG